MNKTKTQPLAQVSTLGRIAHLKQQIAKMEANIEALMPDAIAEAFQVLQSGSSPNGKKVVYEGKEAKIVLVLKKRTDLKDRVVMRLDEDIKAEVMRLSKLNQADLKAINDKVSRLKSQIESLEKERDIKLTSSYLLRLKKHYKIAYEQAAYLVPSLSTFLK
ncbi:hypothetical protein PN499_22145 [Kamptonema animale CS-326]|jgi:hypothetical protein|uniref:hypothetical protein n=1 Tax=Kamptonema animale TaxID=92934 RepID=UPI00232DBE95|nr:hypothetical protein [Kamptonema animale]MDB9513905.1 hypothetical protein [Kamptonema animale CS-326]